jgi:prepilin-type N-terminal cleavage/methylation domain-containing protein
VSRGVTLVELLVVLLLLGMIAGMSGLARGWARGAAGSEARWESRVRSARAEAIRTGLPVQVVGESGAAVLVLPDGRAFGGGVEPLSGEPTRAPR